MLPSPAAVVDVHIIHIGITKSHSIIHLQSYQPPRVFAGNMCRPFFLSSRVAVNYYARNDPLVKLDRRAAELMKLTSDTKFQEVGSCDEAIMWYLRRVSCFASMRGGGGRFRVNTLLFVTISCSTYRR